MKNKCPKIFFVENGVNVYLSPQKHTWSGYPDHTLPGNFWPLPERIVKPRPILIYSFPQICPESVSFLKMKL